MRSADAPDGPGRAVSSMRPCVMRDTSSRSSTSRVSCVTWRLITSTPNCVCGSSRAIVASSSLALRSGALAAACLIPFFHGQALLGEAVKRYSDEYAGRFGAVFQNSSKIRRMLRLPRAVRHPVVALLTRVPAVTKYLVRKTR